MRKYVSKIVANNWQGEHFNKELAPLTAIIGQNMEGKSALVSGLRVGLVGYSPEHGKTNIANWGFIGSEKGTVSGSVRLEFSDQKSVNELHLEMRKGKVEVPSRIQDVKVPPVLLDLHEEFFKLSGPKRTDFVFGKMDMSKEGFAVEEITARLKKDVKVKEPSAETEAKLGEIIDEVEELDRNREDLRWSYQLFIEKCVAKIDERAKAAATTVEQMAGTQQGTTVLRGADAPLPAFNQIDLKKARENHQELLGKKKNAEQIKAADEKLRTQKLAYEEAIKRVPDHGAQIKVKENERVHLEKEIDGHKSTVSIKLKDRQSQATKHAEVETTINLKTEALTAKQAQYDADKKKKCCPRCGAKGKGWEKAQVQEIDEIEALQREIADLVESKSKLAQGMALQDTRIAEAEATDNEVLKATQRINQLKREIQELNDAMAKVKVGWAIGAAKQEQVVSLEVAKAQLAQIENDLKERPAPASYDEAAIENARLEVEQLEELERAHSTKAADELRIEEAKQKKIAAEAENEVASKALKVFKALKAEMIEKAFTGFMDKVNRFTRGLFRNATSDLKFRDGEIGYMRGATWVTLDHFSGTEKMLTYIGLSVALAEESPLRIVFVDEWLRDDEMRNKVAARLAELQKADVIDQIIVIDTHADGYDALGFTMVSLKK